MKSRSHLDRGRLRFELLESRALLTVFTFQDGVYPDAGYAGTRDTQLSENAPNTKYGTAVSLNVDGDDPASTGKDVAALLRWDLSSLAPGTPVQTATITLNVTNHSAGQQYSIYEVKRDWVETQAAWTTWSSGNLWQTAGAQGSLDRGAMALGTAAPSATGSYTVTLNTDGGLLVKRWIESPGTNYGMIIAGATSTNGFDFSSSEATTATTRPKLTIDTGPPGGPGPNLPPSVMVGQNQVIWLPSAATLDATVTDDGAFTVLWTVVSAPAGGTAQFANSMAVDTTATFNIAGTYTLRLTATDADYAITDEVIITVVGEADTVTYAVIGDYGTADANEDAVADLVKTWNPAFVLTVGDNTYQDAGDTSPAEFDRRIGQYYQEFIGDYGGTYGPGSAVSRFFPTLGNHDWLGSSYNTYLNYFPLPGIAGNNSGNERYYKFRWGPVEFFALNNEVNEPDGFAVGGTQGMWASTNIAASTAPWQVVYFHHPTYSSNTGSTTTRFLDWPFQTWGADAVLNGHVHNFERLNIGGLPYIIDGLGGATVSTTGSPDPGSQARFDNLFGAMRVIASAVSMTFEFFSTTIVEPRTITLVDKYTIASDVLVPEKSTWKYLDDGSNQGTAWRNVGFNDASWASGSGQLGYADGDETTAVDCGTGPPTDCAPGNSSPNKYVTTYFRNTFNVTDKSRYGNLDLRVLRDDGVAVYLNGTEIFRNSLAAGAAWNTLATTNQTNENESTFISTTITDLTPLANGANTLAVEIHQASTSSEDISFDLQLVGVDTTGPRIDRLLVGSSTALETSHPDCDFSANQACKVGTGEQLKTVPVAAADQIKIKFREAMVQTGPGGLDQNDLTLVKASADGTALTVTGYSWDPASNTATWTFAAGGAPAKGQFVVTLSDSVIDPAGNRLDGEWTNPTSLSQTMPPTSTFPSGNGTPKGTVQFYITLLPGDVNRDNLVNSTDTSALLSHWGQTGVGWIEGDMTGEGAVGNDDLNLVQQNLNTDYTTWPAGGGMGPMGGGGGEGAGESFRDSVLSFLATDHNLSPQAVDEILKWLDENAPG